MNAVHCIQIHQAMDIYLYMYKNILAPELWHTKNKNIKRQSNSVKNKVSQQPQTTFGCIFLRFGNKSINRESPIHCHFELLNQYLTTFFDQEVEYTYIIL